MEFLYFPREPVHLVCHTSFPRGCDLSICLHQSRVYSERTMVAERYRAHSADVFFGCRYVHNIRRKHICFPECLSCSSHKLQKLLSSTTDLLEKSKCFSKWAFLSGDCFNLRLVPEMWCITQSSIRLLLFASLLAVMCLHWFVCVVPAVYTHTGTDPKCDNLFCFHRAVMRVQDLYRLKEG